MEVLADLWMIWLLATLAAILYCTVMYAKLVLSIIRDDEQTFDMKIYRRLWDYGIGFVLIFVFFIMLIISAIANLVVFVTD